MKLKTKHPYLLISILTIGIAVLISLVLFPTEPCIRITGMVLQLLGVCSVIVGITETRQLFGEPSIIEIIKGKIRTIFKRSVTIKVDDLTAHSHVSDNVRASQRRPFGLNQTFEERIITLERNITFIDDDLKSLQEEMNMQKSEIFNRINGESEKMQIEISLINKKLKESATGGIHISAIGAAWLFFGVILTSLAPELAKWIN